MRELFLRRSWVFKKREGLSRFLKQELARDLLVSTKAVSILLRRFVALFTCSILRRFVALHVIKKLKVFVFSE